MTKIFLFSTLLFVNLLSASEGFSVKGVVPPADACRGLVKVSETEFRHYSNQDQGTYMLSRDGGENWQKVSARGKYPLAFGGVSKEAPSLVQNPRTKEWIRIQAVRGPIFLSKGGLDGEWYAVTKSGGLSQSWQGMSRQKWLTDLKSNKTNLLTLKGLLRTPIFVNNGKRIVIPAHKPLRTYYSDDNGLTWQHSNTIGGVPSHQMGGVHKGIRWQNKGVGGTLCELPDGRLWMLVRTSRDELYESFSKDMGETWSEARPSRFFATLTLATIGELEDGRLLLLWNNYTPLPEVVRTNKVWMKKHNYKTFGGEDCFNNRDALHAAISDDGGLSWHGFREVVLDEHRNNRNYATFNGQNDRGKHQTEFFQTGDNEIFLTVGQHAEHRKFAHYDFSVLYAKKRSNSFENGLDDWTVHSFIPVVKGHCGYNRKPSSKLIDHQGERALLIRRHDDKEMVNSKYDIDYQKGGAAWNFPNGKKGSFEIEFTLNEGTQGTQLSLMDRLFNAVDETAQKFAIYSMNLKAGEKVGEVKLKHGEKYKMTLAWDGVEARSKCSVLINGKSAGELVVRNQSRNGISYIHLISTANKADSGLLIHRVSAEVE